MSILQMVFLSLLTALLVAAIGSAGPSTDGAGADRRTAHPSVSATARPGGGTSSASSGGVGPADGPSAAQDTEAHCRAYEQVKDNGKALDATAWRQLAEAAGGEDEIAAYCAEQLARATAAPNGSGDTGKQGEGAAGTGTGTAGTSGNSSTTGNSGTSGNSGKSGNGNPGNDAGGADNGAGNGEASGGKGE